MRVVELPGGGRLTLLTADEVYSLQQAEAFMPAVESVEEPPSFEALQLDRLITLVCDLRDEVRKQHETLERLIQILGS